MTCSKSELRSLGSTVAMALLGPWFLAGTLGAQEAAARGTAGDPGTSPIMATYDFEESHASGPDTFWAHDTADVHVDLSKAFRISGERSLRIGDSAGSHDFPEFLGYLETRTEGAVFWQFYVLFTEVDDVHNFGVCGDGWFLNSEKHGQSFWLQLTEGRLRHHEADGWQHLVAVEPFQWYFVDWLYDIDRGTYDLAIFREGEKEPLVDVRGAMNFTGEKGSSVRYFSFIGDLDDKTEPTYFVDDVLFAADPELRLGPFVAPGRRQLFVERWRREPAEALGIDALAGQAQSLALLVDGAVFDPSQALLVESAADALVAAGRLDEAEALYQALLRHPEAGVRALLKIADVRFLQGDVDGERTSREAIYGRLGFEEDDER